MQIADESRAHGSRVSPCQVEPMEDAIGRVMRETCYRPQTVALPQEGQGFDHHQARATHGLEERVLICTKGVTTSRTGIALFNVTEDPDIASFDCAKVGTGFVVTPLPREFHDVSPPPTHDDTSNGLSWLGVPSEGFTAYVYSTKCLYPDKQILHARAVTGVNFATKRIITLPANLSFSSTSQGNKAVYALTVDCK